MGEYPLLSFLFEVVLVSRLFVVKFEKGNTLVAVADRLDTYLNMTMPEKYVFLLETAWCYVDWSALDNDGRSTWFQGGIEELLNYPVGMPVSLTTHYSRTENMPGQIRVSHTSNAYLRAGYWFGWHDVQEVAQAKRRAFIPSTKIHQRACSGSAPNYPNTKPRARLPCPPKPRSKTST